MEFIIDDVSLLIKFKKRLLEKPRDVCNGTLAIEWKTKNTLNLRVYLTRVTQHGIFEPIMHTRTKKNTLSRT